MHAYNQKYKIQTSQMSRQQQIRLHHQKWRRWKMQMKTEDYSTNKQKSQKPQQSAHNYAVKIIQKLKDEERPKCPISHTFEKEFESNACHFCYEIMIPPRNPFTLFPCGHNMCKICLLLNPSLKQKNKTLKTKNCQLCGTLINNYAENRSLMNLICTYTDNKHLIVKEDHVQQQNMGEDHDAVKMLRLRCEILQKQKKSISTNLAREKKNKQVLKEVLEKLASEKARNQQQTSKLQSEAKLIENFLKEKKLQLAKIKEKIQNTEEKKRVVQKTLEPLRTQKQKLQILEAARMLER